MQAVSALVAAEHLPACEGDVVVPAVEPSVHVQRRQVRQPQVFDVGVLPVAAVGRNSRHQVRVVRRQPHGREAPVRPAGQEHAIAIHGELAAEGVHGLGQLDVSSHPALDLNVEAAPAVERVGLVGHFDRRSVAAGGLAVLDVNPSAALVVHEDLIALGRIVVGRHVGPDGLDPLHRVGPVRKSHPLAGVPYVGLFAGGKVLQHVLEELHRRDGLPVEPADAAEHLCVPPDVGQVLFDQRVAELELVQQTATGLGGGVPGVGLALVAEPLCRRIGRIRRPLHGRGDVCDETVSGTVNEMAPGSHSD